MDPRATGMFSKRRMFTWLAALVVAALCTVFVLSRTSWTPRSIGESQRRGEVIVGALQVYMQRNGTYPLSLSDLVPDYLARLDPPLAGNGVWDYKRNDQGANFVLRFEGDSPSEPTYWYKSDTHKWYSDSK